VSYFLNGPTPPVTGMGRKQSDVACASPLAPCHQRSVSEQSGVHILRKKSCPQRLRLRYKDTPLILISNSSGRGVPRWSRCGPASADGVGIWLMSITRTIDLSNAKPIQGTLPFLVAKGHETTPVRSTRLLIKARCCNAALRIDSGNKIKCLDA
jgi:hypothetical protein